MLPDQTLALFSAITALFVLLGTAITILVIRRSQHISHLYVQKHQMEHDSRKMNLQEGERMLTQLSREVHDNIGQPATLARISLHRALMINDQSQMRELLSDIEKQLDTIQLEATNISHSANHNYVSSIDFKVLIQDDLEYMSSYKGMAIDFIENGIARSVAPHINILIYRIAQQAFNNIIKHSGATEVCVQLEYGETSFKMTIEDNGIGISNEKLDHIKGIGLNNMRERAILLDGDLLFRSNPNKGCLVILDIPTINFLSF